MRSLPFLLVTMLLPCAACSTRSSDAPNLGLTISALEAKADCPDPPPRLTECLNGTAPLAEMGTVPYCLPPFAVPGLEGAGLTREEMTVLATDAIHWAWAEQGRRLELARHFRDKCQGQSRGLSNG